MKSNLSSPFRPKNLKDYRPKDLRIYTLKAGFKKKDTDFLVIVFNNIGEIEKSNISAAQILQLEKSVLNKKNLEELINE